MNKNIFRSIALGARLALLAAAPAPPRRAQQFQQYVALGDSLTAGWQSGCLVQRNQLNSYPAVLAQILFDGDFELPLVQEIALTDPPTTAVPRRRSSFLPRPLTVGADVRDGRLRSTRCCRGPTTTSAIPGAEVADLTTLTHGDPNGTDLEKLSALILRNITGSPFDDTSAVDQAGILLAPAASSAIATLWIGNNNVLGASTSGIVVDGVTLVSQADFQASYDADHRGHPAGRAAGRRQHSRRDVDPVLDDDPAGPGRSDDPPAGHHRRVRWCRCSGRATPRYPCTPVPPDQGCALAAGRARQSARPRRCSPRASASRSPPAGRGLPLPHGFIDATGPARGRHALSGRDRAAPAADGRVQLGDRDLVGRRRPRGHERALHRDQGRGLHDRRHPR